MKALPSSCVAAVAAFLLLSACDFQGPGGGGPEKDSSSTIRFLVRPTQPEARDMDRTLEITGEVRALISAAVSPRIGDVRVTAVFSDVGDEVPAGHVLAKLEDHNIKQAADEAAVSWREAKVRVSESELALKELRSQKRAQAKVVAQKKKNLERFRAQEAGGAVAEMDLDVAQDEYDRELAQAERLGIQIEKAAVAEQLAKLRREMAELSNTKAQRELLWSSVTAPFKGTISTRNAFVGQLVMRSAGGSEEPIFSLFDPKSLVIEAHVPQRDARDMRSGLTVQLAAEALPGESLKGTIAMVSPIVEEQTGTIMVRVAPEDPAGLKPGLFVSGRIILETRKNTLTVPRKAVAYERERPFVYVIEKKAGDASATDEPEGETGLRVRRIFFKEGLADGSAVEFLPLDEAPEHQLSREDSIVLVGLDRLRDGDSVRLPGSEPDKEKDAKTAASSQEGG